MNLQTLKQEAQRIAKINWNKFTPEQFASLETELAMLWDQAQRYLKTTPNADDNDPKAPGRPWSGAIQYKLIECRDEIILKQNNKNWETRYMAARQAN